MSSSDSTENSGNETVKSMRSGAVAPSTTIQPEQSLIIGETYDNGSLLVSTSLEQLDGMPVITIKHDSVTRPEANFYLEHWFVVTSAGRLIGFQALQDGTAGGEAYAPVNLEPGETLTIQYWENGLNYLALFTEAVA